MKSLNLVNRNKPANTQAKVMKRRSIRYLLLSCMLVASFIAFTFGVSGQGAIFGPRTYTRTPGPLDIFQENFSVSNLNSGFTLLVQNGDASGNLRVSGAEISLNGVTVVGEKEFKQPGRLIQKPVSLLENNTLRVQLRSSPPGSFITIEIIREPIPNLSITSPLSGTVFSTQPITVEGTVDISSAEVTVNGVSANVIGGRFVANNVPLPRDGNNIITAIGTTPGGSTGQASTMVLLDRLPPAIVIDGPRNSFTTADDTISVTGMVRDVITPTPTVLVNGIPATVSNGTFIAMGIPLNMGANKITATATDQVGNQNDVAVTVFRAELPGLRLRILSGQAQNGLINSILPAPLTVQLINVDGDPVPNREVVFQVARGDGTIKNSPPVAGQAGQRTLTLLTDGNGEAAVRFTLGSRTGAGNNRVDASVAGGLSPTEFCATATGGAPDRIAIIPMSNQQAGVINQPLAMPFACVVVNASGNPVAGVPVLFSVTEGGGNFGGNVTATEATGPDGVAHALMTLGPEPGTQNNVATAAFQGQTDPPIVFAASGRAAGLLGNTTFSGLVLDNGDRPLRNARAVIFGTDRSAITDVTGRFLITNVPPGPQLLFIDGSAIADSQGRIFPNLEFDLNVISGVENSLPMPIYLPPLATDPQSVATITGPVTTTIVLKMPGVPESTLTLLPGTIVSNHTGQASASNPITVRLSRVNNDRVPMPPPNGSVFTLAGTVQPAGTHFNPPAKICAPNTGMPPGAQVNIFSFDHDVGQFLSIGFATVSEDGSAICSNPGFGIDKAGWFGGTPPPPPTTEPKNCRVTGVTATPNPVCIPMVVGPQISEEVVITATTDPGNRTVTWSGDTGVNPVISGNTLRTRYATTGEKVVTATCEQSSRSITVRVVQINNVDVHSSDDETENVPSVIAGGLLHFVTARQQNDVVLIASITPDTTEIRDAITWTTTSGVALTSPAVGTDKRTVKFSSNFAQGRRIPIELRISGRVCREIVAWVVSADAAGAVAAPVATPLNTGAGLRIGTVVRADFDGTATIQPAEIITDADRPNLAGANTSAPPGGNNNCAMALAGGGNARWDMSRRIAVRAATTPAGLALGCVDNMDNFPANLAIGNDDAGTGDEDNDPYSAPAAGQITSIDVPGRQGPGNGSLTNGNVGNTYRSQLWFQEFARINLRNRWFVISGNVLWRVDFRFIKRQVTEALWGLDVNGDGDMNDNVTEAMLGVDANGDGDLNDNVGFWDDNNSTSANDNAGSPP